MSEVNTSPELDKNFYYVGNMVTFLVENRLFRVPQYPFLHGSEVFRDMFRVPLGEKAAEGYNDSNPIRLEGVLITEFQALLQILCPPTLFCSLPQGIEEWKSILKLSSMWMFDFIRSQAITKVDSLMAGDEHAMENVILGKRYKISNWILRGYNALVRLPTCPTDEETESIGLRSSIKLFRLRERYQLFSSAVLTCPRLSNHTSYNYTLGVLSCCGQQYHGGIVPRQHSNTVNINNLNTILIDQFYEEFSDVDPSKYPPRMGTKLKI